MWHCLNFYWIAIEHKEYAEDMQASRDIIKIRKQSFVHQIEFVMLKKEAQEHIHYAMLMRIMKYDYSTYKKQYDNNARNYKTTNSIDEDESLPRMKKTDKLVPVIIIVIYYEEKPWDGATSLHEMLSIPEEMKPFVNGYKMLLVEERKNRLTFHNIKNVDLFNLLEIILNKEIPWKEARNKAIEYAKEHKTDKSMIMTIASATNCKIDYNAFEKKENADMCTVFEETREEGKIEERTEEIVVMGCEFGFSEGDILERLQRELNVSLKKAQGYFKMFEKKIGNSLCN